MSDFDVIILGGGPAGLAAAIYAGRALLKAAVIERSVLGGQILLTNEIANYPGAVSEESGYSLMERFEKSAKDFGAAFIYDTIEKLELEGEIKTLYGQNGQYRAKAVILSTGASPRKLGVPGEERFIGKGVSYCATCDGAFFKNKDVFVVGGGDAAVEEAAYLTRFARKVTLIHRRDELRASKQIQERAFGNEKMEFLWDTVVLELCGENLLSGIKVKNVKTGEESLLGSSVEGENIGFFVFVGIEPNNALFADEVNLDELGFVVTDEEMKTRAPGVYAAGDIRKKSLRQVVTAAADGAIAAAAAAKLLEE